MKLKAAKCVFAVVLGKFLGYMVSQQGIKANPDNNRGQITKNSEGGLELDKKGRSSKQIRLQGNGQVHTIVQGFEKGLLVDWWVWRSPYKIKRVLDKTTITKSFSDGKKIYLYLVVSYTTVSSALIREEENVQKLVYYTNRAF